MTHRTVFLETTAGSKSRLASAARLVCLGTALLCTALLCTALLVAPYANAASLRCDKGILPQGSHMFEVSELCGEPVAEFSRVEFLIPQVPVYIDEWVYRLGKTRFQRILRFENGRLRRIRTLRKPRPEPYTGAGGQPTAAEYKISY